MKETDLFPPVKILLESLGFNVYAEARNCDVVGRKKEELVIVELKKNLNLTLLSQGMQRQKLTHQVFLCVPEPRKKNSSTRSKEELIKRLGLGLITVYTSPVRSAAKIIFEPSTENRGPRTEGHQLRSKGNLKAPSPRTMDQAAKAT